MLLMAHYGKSQADVNTNILVTLQYLRMHKLLLSSFKICAYMIYAYICIHIYAPWVERVSFSVTVLVP